MKCRDVAKFLCADIAVTNDAVSVDPDSMTASPSVVQVGSACAEVTLKCTVK